MCDQCAAVERQIERLKELVVQVSDFDEDLVLYIVRAIVDKVSGGCAMRIGILLLLLVALVGCRDDEITGSSNAPCAEKLFSPYDPKILDQCVNVCARCERGTMTTCATSCRLRGAR
ncbi:hypothetical protein BSZ21_06155 [Bradyrhizobium canariense]|nr:hypothetical protein BSZ21_06155 [Bradyrhizobium canariense]